MENNINENLEKEVNKKPIEIVDTKDADEKLVKEAQSKKVNRRLNIAIFVLTVALTFTVTKCHYDKSDKVEEVATLSVEDTIIENKKIELTAENIDEIVNNILEDNNAKGLYSDPTNIKSALIITNIDYLKQEDIKKLYTNDTNMGEEVEQMYKYISNVRTHNNNGNEYIPLYNLAYEEEDKLILKDLDDEYFYLKEVLNSKTISDDKQLDNDNQVDVVNPDFKKSFEKIRDFYNGTGCLALENGKKYKLTSLTSGAGLLAEKYWPILEHIYGMEYLEYETQVEKNTLSTEVNNGSRWLGAIINHESLGCLEDNALTK